MSEEMEFEEIELTEETTPEEIETLENWVGDKRYFQTGKKQGQLKPKYKDKAPEETPIEKPIENAPKAKDDSESIEAEISAMNSDYATVEMPTQEEAPQRSLISGFMLLMVADALIPSLFSFVYSKVKGKKIDSRKLRLSKQEREEMRELADEAAKFMLLSLNPVSQLAIVMGAMYFGKIMEYED